MLCNEDETVIANGLNWLFENFLLSLCRYWEKSLKLISSVNDKEDNVRGKMMTFKAR